MSPTQLDGKATSYPSPLKINKDSHFIKKPPTSPPPATSSAAKPPHRQPVIIYTHSPKIIHTHPRDFMALVQKLTGQSPSDSEFVAHRPPPPKQEPPPVVDQPNKNHRLPMAAAASDHTDSSSSEVTVENCTSTRVRNVQIKSCFPPPPPPPPATMTTAFYDHPPPINPCFSDMNIPFFPSPNSGDFYSSSTLAHQPFFGNYNDSSLLLMNNNNINIRSSISSSSSSSTFDGMA
ncbi:hypothetical protein Vadar_024017 [Vaccinium darrowii]|uniref:Uncharacterized protein n=1 Tax=Vaccinium darrowii TaxID=229202 RepID=A0ACB7YHT4_9ERIC|nr:hypothetical protein Vadar_024017 [Vaccinium darrowii]